MKVEGGHRHVSKGARLSLPFVCLEQRTSDLHNRRVTGTGSFSHEKTEIVRHN